MITKLSVHDCKVGDLVLLKRMAYKGKQKIWDHWEKTVYKVEGQPSTGMLALRICLVDRNGKVKIVHQNLVLPIGTGIEASGV